MRLDVKVKGEVPVLFLRFHDGAGMHVARAVEQDVRRADALCRRVDFILLQHIEGEGLDPGLLAPKRGQGLGIDVGGPDPGPLLRHADGGGAADALAGRGDESGFSCKPSGHGLLSPDAFYCAAITTASR